MRGQFVNLYRALQVDPAAEDCVIRAAYRALMKEHHPDRGGNVALAQSLNAAYATLADPIARDAYDRLVRIRGAQPRPGPDLTVRTLAGGRSLAEELGGEVFRRFVPDFPDGLSRVWDFTGVLRGVHRHRLWLRRVWRSDSADARAFAAAVEAARLSRPLWAWGSDLFVAVLPHVSQAFRWLLRGPNGPLPRVSYAVALYDLETREMHAVGRAPELPVFRPFLAAVEAGRPSEPASAQPNT
jgi:hypothetical protein